MFTPLSFRRLIAARSRARLVRTTRIRWQRHLLFVVGGALVGTAAAMLAMLADLAQDAFFKGTGHAPWLAWCIPPLGFALAAYFAMRFFPNTQGSGIPQAIAAHHTASKDLKGQLLSWRVVVGKITLTLFGLMCGASAGREGPTVQIGASIMHSLGRIASRNQRGLIVAGSAAGVAAAFNTPLAGIVFGIEELSRSFDRRHSALIVLGVVAAGFTSIALLGNYTYFGSSAGELHGVQGGCAVVVCGLVCGLAGGLFSRLAVAGTSVLPRGVDTFLKAKPIVFAALCGLGVAMCGMLSNESIYGTGYRQVRMALDGIEPLAPEFGLLKFAATLLTALSAIPGGIFSPSLAIGAGLATNIGAWFPAIDPGALLLLGMVAYLAGVVQAPITAFVIVLEMTGSHSMLSPLMVAALIGSNVSKMVCREGIYHALAQRVLMNFKRQAIA